MKSELFQFKRFSVSHSACSMKIGVDAVLLGCLADVTEATAILDAGCGCGVISLICAQRVPAAQILGIDIHIPSVKEAAVNFAASPWAERMEAEAMDYLSIEDKKFSLIVSNPPYFNSGLHKLTSAREKARHADALSPVSILQKGVGLLSPKGSIAIICPPEWLPDLQDTASKLQLYLGRIIYIKGTLNSPVKRIFTQWYNYKVPEAQGRELVIEAVRGVPTEEYRNLTKDFYINF